MDFNLFTVGKQNLAATNKKTKDKHFFAYPLCVEQIFLLNRLSGLSPQRQFGHFIRAAHFRLAY